MSWSQAVSTVSSTEYIIQSLKLSFVHYNLTYLQHWELSSALYNHSYMAYLRMAVTSPRILVLPLHFEGQPRGEVLRPIFHLSNYTSRTKKVIGHEHIDDRTGLMCATILVPG
jgi:hypothetical protein